MAPGSLRAQRASGAAKGAWLGDLRMNGTDEGCAQLPRAPQAWPEVLLPARTPFCWPYGGVDLSHRTRMKHTKPRPRPSELGIGTTPSRVARPFVTTVALKSECQ